MLSSETSPQFGLHRAARAQGDSGVGSIAGRQKARAGAGRYHRLHLVTPDSVKEYAFPPEPYGRFAHWRELASDLWHRFCLRFYEAF